LKAAVEIRDICEANIRDVASFCLRGCQKEEWYCEGDCRRIRQAWIRKRKYLATRLGDGARAKIAYVHAMPAGFIEYYPMDTTNYEMVGSELSAIWCINIKEDYRGRGIGRLLLEKCLKDCRDSGFRGVAVGCWDPIWMPSQFFKRHGFEEVAKAGSGKLLLYRFSRDAEPPRWVGRGKFYDDVELAQGKAVLDIFHSDRCPIHWRNTSLILEIAAEYGDRLLIRQYNTDDRSEMLKHKIEYAVYLDGEAIAMGPPVKAHVVRRRIGEAIRSKLGGKT